MVESSHSMSTEIYQDTDLDDASSKVSGEWETVTTSTDGACADGFKRHKWEGGDTCVRCGADKPATSTVKESSTKPTGIAKTRGPKIGDLESLLAMAWSAVGLGIEHQPWVLSQNQDSKVAPTVGKTLQMESGIAGRRLDKTIRRYPAIYRWINKTSTGIVADLVPLFLPPLIMGAAAANPDMARRFKPILMGVMIPLLTEQAKMAEQQAALLSRFESVSAETVEIASDLVDSLIGPDKPTEDDAS